MGTGNSNTSNEQVIKRGGSYNQMLLGDTAFEQKGDTAVQNVINTAGKIAIKVIEGGGDIITTPAIWLRDIQQNWLTYMVVVAIILSLLTFFLLFVLLLL